MKNKRTIIVLIGPALLLLVPLVAMQFSAEVQWSLFDFVVMGVLLYGAGFTYLLLARMSGSAAYRAAAAMAMVTALLLVWMNLAVGIIGNEDNPANALYAGVLGTLFLGALAARFRAAGMARTLYLAAIVQMLVPVIAFITWRPDFSPGVVGVFVLNAIFAALWVGSGLLFQQAGEVMEVAVSH